MPIKTLREESFSFILGVKSLNFLQDELLITDGLFSVIPVLICNAPLAFKLVSFVKGFVQAEQKSEQYGDV